MTLSNIDLEEIAKQLKLPLVIVCSKDELRAYHKRNGSYYVNMQDSDKGGGTHWVLLKIFNPKYAVYFDSFGCPYPIEIGEFLSPVKPMFNNRDIQDLSSDHCGLFCISCDYFFTYKADKKKSVQDNYEEYISSWSKNTKENDAILKGFFN